MNSGEEGSSTACASHGSLEGKKRSQEPPPSSLPSVGKEEPRSVTKARRAERERKKALACIYPSLGGKKKEQNRGIITMHVIEQVAQRENKGPQRECLLRETYSKMGRGKRVEDPFLPVFNRGSGERKGNPRKKNGSRRRSGAFLL